MVTPEQNESISHIANYLAMNDAKQYTFQIMRSYGFQYDPDSSESENLIIFIQHYCSDPGKEDFIDAMTVLIGNYDLTEVELERVDYNLQNLGYMLEEGMVVEIPKEDDFYEFLEQCLRDPEALKAEGGAYDGALLTLTEGLMENDEDFTLIDYGCGEGRLLFALSHIPKVIKKHITYVGVDVDEEHLEALSAKIKESGFESEFKSCTVMNLQDFFEAGLDADYIFMVNVLHEIPLNELPKLIKDLESMVKKDGVMLIHEMRELIEGEMRFVSWDEEDIDEQFKNTSFNVNVRSYNSRSGIPLLNVHLNREGTTSTALEEIEGNLDNMIKNKLKRIEEELKEIEDSGDELRIRRYGYLLMLKRNIELQYAQFVREKLSDSKKEE